MVKRPCEAIKGWHLPQQQVRGSRGCLWTQWRISKLLIKQNFDCTAVAAALSPTLDAVCQKFGSRLLPLLSKSYQSQRFIEGQFAQESIRGVNMLCNLKQTKTIWPEGRQISVWDPTSLVVCIPLCKKLSLDTEGLICWKVRKREILFQHDQALK